MNDDVCSKTSINHQPSQFCSFFVTRVSHSLIDSFNEWIYRNPESDSVEDTFSSCCLIFSTWVMTHFNTHYFGGLSSSEKIHKKTLKWKDDTYCLSHLTSLNWWCFLFRHSLFSFFFFREKINLCSNIHHRCPNLSLTLFCSRILILKRRRKVRFDVISVTMFDPNHFSLLTFTTNDFNFN